MSARFARLRLRLATAPEWLVTGTHPLRVSRITESFAWRRRGEALEVTFRWSRPCDVNQALRSALTASLRARPWDQISGPVYALDRTAWMDGTSSWPQGLLAPSAPELEVDAFGRPLGAFLPPELSVSARSANRWAPFARGVITAVANPFGRRLVGAASPYRLAQDGGRLILRDQAGHVAGRLDPEAGIKTGLLGSTIDKYAVIGVDSLPPDESVIESLRALAACGAVFAAADPSIREYLGDAGLVAVAHLTEVDDLRGYALSVAASRQMAITGDAALRRTALGGEGVLPLPTVSVVLSSMRADHIESCLGYLATQTYPALEVVVGLHGYKVSDEVGERWRAKVSVPLRILSFPAELTFGMVLGRLSRVAEGELITKVDDDDRYGRITSPIW